MLYPVNMEQLISYTEGVLTSLEQKLILVILIDVYVLVFYK